MPTKISYPNANESILPNTTQITQACLIIARDSSEKRYDLVINVALKKNTLYRLYLKGERKQMMDFPHPRLGPGLKLMI